MATKKTNTTGTKTPVAEAVKTEAVKAAAEVKADAAKAVKAVEKVAEKLSLIHISEPTRH